jgi:arginyl-tRNA--protein-N-Asp/Glu arginylyltransferase
MRKYLDSDHAITISTEHATISTEHATISTEHATISTDHATISTDHATISTEHALATTNLSLPAPQRATSHPKPTPIIRSNPIAALVDQVECGRLRLELKQSCFEQESFELFIKYQTKIHNDPPEKLSVSSYKNFLVDSPLLFSECNLDQVDGFGSFHQKYYLDDKLIAVAVLDILPLCVSSVYFFYDPDYSFLSLGNYSALREISLTTRLNSQDLKYYYMGYYIHDCQKMKYKIGYRPSELLCPNTFKWVSYEMALPLINKQLSTALSDGNGPLAFPCKVNLIFKNVNLEKHLIHVWLKSKVFQLPYEKLPKDDQTMIKAFLDLIGDDLLDTPLVFIL